MFARILSVRAPLFPFEPPSRLTHSHARSCLCMCVSGKEKGNGATSAGAYRLLIFFSSLYKVRMICFLVLPSEGASYFSRYLLHPVRFLLEGRKIWGQINMSYVHYWGTKMKNASRKH